jgi:hypothetical protein
LRTIFQYLAAVDRLQDMVALGFEYVVEELHIEDVVLDD